MLFDTHTHLNADQFEGEEDAVIEEPKRLAYRKCSSSALIRRRSSGQCNLVETYDFLYAAVGWHPVDAKDMTDDDLNWIEELASHPKVVAIGETGLDYYWDKSSKDVQKEVFKQQIQLAKKVKLPLVIHNREATDDVIEILKQEGADEVGGVMHCFSGTLEQAKKCIDLNFYISFAGPVTFKNAKPLQEVAREVPLERILIETDCPYLLRIRFAENGMNLLT